MRDPAMTSLREAVRVNIIQAFALFGYAKPRDIARTVCACHPIEIQVVGSQLAEDALTDVARRELKKATQDKNVVNQLQLPGLDDHFTKFLPGAISIPVPGLEGDQDDSVIYKPLAQATLAEVQAHLTLLDAQITADIRRHRALTELHDMALAMGATGASLVFDVIGATQNTETEVA